MPAAFHIRYYNHQEIDKKKWDLCIATAGNGLIYSTSIYLDHMSPNWSALILNDYEAVMPLTWRKKYGIHYLYQPSFTANLGIFGNRLSKELIEEFISCIPGKYKLIEISLNSGNNELVIQNPFPRTNYVLPLDKPYNDLNSDFRENHRRNIQKAYEAGCVLKRNIPIDHVIELNKDLMKNNKPVKERDYNNFKKLYLQLFDRNYAVSYGIVNARNKLISSAAFFFSHKRAYYVLVGNHQLGKTVGASHALIDSFIKDHAGENLILDFEGSDKAGLAFFYEGFGAKKELYPALRINRLPFYLRWLK